MTPPPALPPGSDPSEHPDVPDEQGRVWCDRCLRRVTPEERRRHRGGRSRERERLVELTDGELETLHLRRPRRTEWGWNW